MERWERSGTHLRRGQEVGTSPSFSSSLLDAIYRSIDEGDDTCKGGNRTRNYGHEKDDLSYITTTTTRKCFATTVETKKQISTVVTEKVGHRRRGCEASFISEFDRRTFKPNQKERERYVFNSTSSSSESSYGGFSSSEAESARVKSYGRQPPLPVRSERSALASLDLKKKQKQENQSTSNSIGNRFRESKIYSELKKAKAPISPGGRLANFINQLFNSASHSKKAKTSSQTTGTVTGRRGNGDDSTCSTASSYSRSCLSKTPSSRTKTTNSGKRSVRFYPVNIILGDDLRPCGQKCVYDDHSYEYERIDISAAPPLPPLPAVRVRHPVVVEEEEKAGDLIERPYSGKSRVLGMGFEEIEDDEDDDAASYSSSDLFELENLTTIGCEMGGVGGGGERYNDELPVYETTHLHTNRAIAQGLIA